MEIDRVSGKMDSRITVRAAESDDMPEVARIYAHHVLNCLATFETEAPSRDEMQRRFRRIVDGGFPYLVATRAGEVVGYAYAGPYRPREAYRYTVENSIYVRCDLAGQKIGTLLMKALISECTVRGFKQMIAVIGDSENHASIGLHKSLGFRLTGVLHSVGYKFDRWVDSVLMQLELQDDYRQYERANK